MDRAYYMRQALDLARQAIPYGDVPVGCVVVRDGEIIGRGYNRREQNCDAVAHAEVEAIRQACQVVGGWNLHQCQLYVTLEPCAMCAGAIINAKIGTLCYGAKEEKTGACGSVLNLFEEGFPHRPRIYGGILAEECSDILSQFFQEIREKPRIEQGFTKTTSKVKKI